MPLPRKLVAFALSCVVVSAAAAGCSGKTTDATSDAGTPTASESGTSGTHTIGCPDTLPWTRTTANGPENPCTQDGQVCEYGTDFDPGCNKTVECRYGVWSVPFMSGGRSVTCGSPAPKPTPNPSDCPATKAEVIEGAACSASSKCSYDGAECTCGVYCPQYPVGRPTCDPDAGITQNCCDRSKPSTWSCFVGVPYCSTPRPYVGDPCTTPDDACALAPPGECGQTQLRCRENRWELFVPQCPISTARAKKEIAYVSEGEAAKLKEELLRLRLATYRYKAGDPAPHLGFVIEDLPAGSPAVFASRERVDLYGYMSMAVATIQEQQKQLDRLEAEVARLKRERAR
jgi:hypothetical protein